MCVYIHSCVVCVSVCVKCDGVKVSECEGESACQCFKLSACVCMCVRTYVCVLCVSLCKWLCACVSVHVVVTGELRFKQSHHAL